MLVECLPIMSVVHDNLSRQYTGRSEAPADKLNVADPVVDELPAAVRETGRGPAECGDEIDEIRRKEQLLTEGIRALQDSVLDLNGQLEAAQRDLAAQREENQRLRARSAADRTSGKSLLAEASGMGATGGSS